LRGLRSLRSLILHDNQITEIRADDFKYVPTLENLDLEANMISRLKTNAFAHLSQLHELDLEWNSIAEVEDDAFSGLAALQFMDLGSQRGQLRAISPETFRGMPDLRWLWLEGNEISRLQSNMFRNNLALEYLHLPSNNIRNVPWDAFAGLSKLTVLNLAHNAITHMEWGHFHAMPDLHTVLLGNSPLRCQLALPGSVRFTDVALTTLALCLPAACNASVIDLYNQTALQAMAQVLAILRTDATASLDSAALDRKLYFARGREGRRCWCHAAESCWDLQGPQQSDVMGQ
jgi:hypothetical protein